MASGSDPQASESNAVEENKALNHNGVDTEEEPSANGANGTEKAESSTPGQNGPKRFGKVKWFNVTKGWGFIAAEDGTQDVFVHQSVIRMEGFRSLAEGERVEFEARQSEKGLEATVVTGPNGKPCLGSNRHPPTKRKFRKSRCYNCGEYASHVAARCDKGVMPKRCHSCRSEDHLIKDCPRRAHKQNGHAESGGSSETDRANGAGESAVSTDTNQVAPPPSKANPEPESSSVVPAGGENAVKREINTAPKTPKKK